MLRPFFIDTVAFVALIKSADEFRPSALKLLQNVHEGNQPARASAISLLEVAYVVRKLGGTAEDVSKAIHACLSIKNLDFLPITPEIIRQASDHMILYKLQLSDAVIAASMAQENMDHLASEDTDFDRVPFLTRVSLSRAAALQR